MSAWTEATKRYRQQPAFKGHGLDLKCAAWIAGFPINNAEVVLYDEVSASVDEGDSVFSNLSRLEKRFNGDQAGIRDFAGPSIDTGFRVASASSPRRFVITVDLAFMLAHAAGNLGTLEPPIDHLVFHYDGRKSLKGVTNGAPYPVFWINASEPERLEEIEDALEKREAVPHSKVKDFCEHFLDKNKDTHVMRPYLIDDPDPTFQKTPERHKEKLKTLAKYFANETLRRSTEQQQLPEAEVLFCEQAAGDQMDLAQRLLEEIKTGTESSASDEFVSKDEIKS